MNDNSDMIKITILFLTISLKIASIAIITKRQFINHIVPTNWLLYYIINVVVYIINRLT